MLWHAAPCIAVPHSVHSHEYRGHTLLLSGVAHNRQFRSQPFVWYILSLLFYLIRSIAILFKKPELLLDPISVQFSLFFWGQDMLGDTREDHKGKQSNATAESLNKGDRQMPVVSGRPLISRQKRHWSMFPYRSSLVLFKHDANVL